MRRFPMNYARFLFWGFGQTSGFKSIFIGNSSNKEIFFPEVYLYDIKYFKYKTNLRRLLVCETSDTSYDSNKTS